MNLRLYKMFGKELAHEETYYKEYGDYKVSSSYTVYEAFIELQRDKEGNVVTNKDGSERYRYIDANDVKELEEDKRVKQIREGLYKDVYEVNGDVVELVEKENKRIYYVVEESRLTTLAKGTSVMLRNGLYRVVSEVGYVLVDDIEIDHPKIIAVRKFKTDDHQKEAEEIVKGKTRKLREED